jgi:hypothetical protein
MDFFFDADFRLARFIALFIARFEPAVYQLGKLQTRLYLCIANHANPNPGISARDRHDTAANPLNYLRF